MHWYMISYELLRLKWPKTKEKNGQKYKLKVHGKGIRNAVLKYEKLSKFIPKNTSTNVSYNEI